MTKTQMEYKLAHSFEANAFKITYDWCFLILTIIFIIPNANKVHSISLIDYFDYNC